MKDVSPESERVLSAVRKLQEILDSLSVEDHAACLPMLQVLGERRVVAHRQKQADDQAELKKRAQSSLVT